MQKRLKNTALDPCRMNDKLTVLFELRQARCIRSHFLISNIGSV